MFLFFVFNLKNQPIREQIVVVGFRIIEMHDKNYIFQQASS